VQVLTFPWIFFKMEIPKKKETLPLQRKKPMFAYVVAIFFGGEGRLWFFVAVQFWADADRHLKSEEDFKQLLCDQPEDSAALPSSPVAANMNRP